jgi:predicted DNA-binding transcriptional regulator AlpA
MEATHDSRVPAIRDHKSLLTARTLSSLLCISQRTIRRWLRAGHFPKPMWVGPYGSPRWHPDDVIEYLQSTERREMRSRVRIGHAGQMESSNAGQPGSLREIPGTVSQGVVIPDAPLPEGVRVEIRLTDRSTARSAQGSANEQESTHTGC